MSIPEWFKRIERKLPWSFIGVFLGVCFFIAGLYLALHKPKPDISFEIINEAQVLDVLKPLEDLAIFFKGENLQEKNLNLRILTIQVSNIGEVDILQNHYDKKDIWGIQVKNANIIETRLVDANSEYLKSNLNPKLLRDGILEFKKVIFETGKFFLLELLVLHERGNPPEIIPLGKIAGIDKTVPVKTWLEKQKRTFLGELFHGSILVHVVRPFVYLLALMLAFVILFLGVFIPIDKIGSLPMARKRKKIQNDLDNFMNIRTFSEERRKRIEELIAKSTSEGPDAVIELKKLLDDRKKMVNLMKEYELDQEALKRLRNLRPKGETTEEKVFLSGVGIQLSLYRKYPVHDLAKEGLLTLVNENEVAIDPEFKQDLDKFVEYLETSKK